MLARYMQRKFQQKVNDMFGQMFGQAPGQSDTTHDNEAYSRRQDAHGRYRQRKSKIILPRRRGICRV